MKKYALLILTITLAACTTTQTTKPSASPSTEVANPAAVYCVQQGGKSEIVTAPDGSQTGRCAFPDGRQCEEWQFYRDKSCMVSINRYHLGGSLVKRNFKPEEKWIYSENYPNEISAVKENDLVSFRCTPNLYYDTESSGYKYFDDQTKAHREFKDDTASELLSKARAKHAGNPEDGITMCETENGDFYITFGVAEVGGGIGYTTYISKAYPTERRVEELGKIAAEKMVYFGCRKLLQISKTALYYNCGGGDGPGGNASIYSVGTATKQVERIRTCEYLYNENTKQTNVTCSK